MMFNFLDRNPQSIVLLGLIAIGLITSCQGVSLPNEHYVIPARTKETNTQFTFIKLTPSKAAQYALDPNLVIDKNHSYYLLSGPTQRSGGFTIEILNTHNTLKACIRMPTDEQRVSTAFFTPAVIIKTPPGAAPEIEYFGLCN